MATRRTNVKITSLPVWFMKEGEVFIAYSPALDLSTCGDTFEQAQQRFSEAADLFFEECVRHHTLEEALLSYGWQKASRPSPHWIPPVVVGHIEQPVRLPVPA